MNYIVVTQEWLAARNILPLPTMRKKQGRNEVPCPRRFLQRFQDKE